MKPAIRIGRDTSPGHAEILRELLPRVRGWTYRLLGPGDGLDDAVQDALIEIARALPRFRGDASVATYAHRITVRVTTRHIKLAIARRREVSLELVLVPPVDDKLDPRAQAVQRESVRRLYRCLDQLSARRRVAFVLCDLEGHTPAEAASIAGVIPATMRSRLRHARSELRKLASRDPYLRRFEPGGSR